MQLYIEKDTEIFFLVILRSQIQKSEPLKKISLILILISQLQKSDPNMLHHFLLVLSGFTSQINICQKVFVILGFKRSLY